MRKVQSSVRYRLCDFIVKALHDEQGLCGEQRQKIIRTIRKLLLGCSDKQLSELPNKARIAACLRGERDLLCPKLSDKTVEVVIRRVVDSIIARMQLVQAGRASPTRAYIAGSEGGGL